MDRKLMLDLLLEQRLVAVLRTHSRDHAELAAAAVAAGGARIIEVTWTVPAAAEVVRSLKKHLPSEVAIGCGTILDEAALDEAMAVGADFVISPDVNPELVQLTRERNILHAPGAMTPTEIRTAVRAGASIVKLFPIASLGGAGHVRTLRGPLPTVPFLVSGGVTLDRAEEYFAAGASAVGLTDTLIDPAALARNDSMAITQLTRQWVERLRALPR